MELTGSKFEGELQNGRMEGHARFTFPEGSSVFEGEMKDGMFHGDGTLHFPDGGKYVAKWDHGRVVEGRYIFKDGLVWERAGWDYCLGDDRRFYSERVGGIRPAGESLQTNTGVLPPIPQGCFDTGAGYYDPNSSFLYSYTGVQQRKPEKDEIDWITKHCRIQR
ncbi:putative radial spoke head 1 [Paratrimastix pyriformis]|uniref:MORN repeat-containing protein 5 n=1 Tax=Paratrimastix pyriformis TaxID=342808 RepID=A0ABQ8URZ8_9EUKA|nr:putative radial spoke head 1 [Paratrimastix pyriformis]